MGIKRAKMAPQVFILQLVLKKGQSLPCAITKGTHARLFQPKKQYFIKFWPFEGLCEGDLRALWPLQCYNGVQTGQNLFMDENMFSKKNLEILSQSFGQKNSILALWVPKDTGSKMSQSLLGNFSTQFFCIELF